jgi:hypothetical protein
MGVTYKLREEVVHFIISQRQSNPLASCRQLAESASQKFALNLSKSSIHDVLKESGILTPRGRKPKNKFEIPQEKKKQIQESLSQVKMLTVQPGSIPLDHSLLSACLPAGFSSAGGEESLETSLEYDGAGGIFLKAALWDLGIFSEENIKATDWDYYLTYTKGIEVVLENNKSFFIDLPLPLERCIREVADGLINNVKPFIVHKVSDEGLFKACMDAQAGFKIDSISIVDGKDHVLLKLNNIMELNRKFMLQKRVFVESSERNLRERSKAIFFPQLPSPSAVIPAPTEAWGQAKAKNFTIDNISNLKGFNSINRDVIITTLLMDNSCENKAMFLEAAEKLNGMYLHDEKDRLVSVSLRWE